ncbi:type I restriction enzyme endonuclease domain-containing protein [Vibrio splendidus]|uniref:type I restriction enzyme endonuclease domain-containing protein n=1 Tax=Vibrio splendidus TaxID=29497 RepID=UPI001F52CE1A|nr:type I restriction enzyme endonuclease domain-containing protein [Vibrio splendidus]
MYSQDDQNDIMESMQNIDSEVPVLESRYRRLLQLFSELDVHNIEAFVNQKLSVDEHYQVQLQAISVLEDPRQRDSFNVFLKKFLQSMDIIMPNSLADPYKTPMYQFVHIQAKARQRYQDDSMSFQGVGAKIRHLVNEHLISLGINPKIKPIDLFSDAFMTHMGKEPDLQAQASEMEHAIRKHCKVNADDDPVFHKKMSEKLDDIIKKRSGNWEKMILELSALRDEIDAGRGPNAKVSDPFFDLIVQNAFQDGEPIKPYDKVQACVEAVMEELGENIGSLDFWEREDLISELEGKVEMRFLLSGVPQLSELSEQLTTEVVALARRRELLILSEQALNERIDEIIEMLRAVDPEALQKQISEQPDLSMLKYDLDGVDLYLTQELEQYESFYELALIKVATDINYAEDAEHHSSLPYEVRKQFLLNAEDVREALADIILSIQSELTFPAFEHKPIVALKETAKGSLFITVVVGLMTNFIYDVIKTAALKGRQPIKDIVSKGGRVKSELPALVERNRAERGLNESNYRISYTEERNLVDDALKQLRDRNLPNQDKNKHH